MKNRKRDMRHTHAHSLAVAVSAVFAAAAGASPMIFTNPAPGEPGHFDWTPPPPTPDPDMETEAYQLLDITQPSTAQHGVNKGPVGIESTFELNIQVFFDPFIFPDTSVSASLSGGRIFVEPGPVPGLLSPGDVVGPGGVIPQSGGVGLWTDDFHKGQFIGSSTSIPLGQHYLGVSFFEFDDQGNLIGDHFGFIGFELFETPDGPLDLFATAWGYETELDTPITIIPAPGAIPLIALGGLLGRRRRAM